MAWRLAPSNVLLPLEVTEILPPAGQSVRATTPMAGRPPPEDVRQSAGVVVSKNSRRALRGRAGAPGLGGNPALQGGAASTAGTISQRPVHRQD
jgi:hypothetical protein